MSQGHDNNGETVRNHGNSPPEHDYDDNDGYDNDSNTGADPDDAANPAATAVAGDRFLASGQ